MSEERGSASYREQIRKEGADAMTNRRIRSAHAPGPAPKQCPRRRPKQAVILLLFLLLLGPSAFSEELVLGNFSGRDLSGWKPKVFRGQTTYSLVDENGRQVLMAQSRGAASGLYKEVTLDPAKYPVLRWSWKIQGTIPEGNGRAKAGDDYAARVYVVFPRTFFFRTRAVNYIWANRIPKGTALPNAFTSNAMMVAVESGDEKAGTWVAEERNVFEDYRTLFGEDPPPIGAVALMTDTDNTGGEAVAYYGDITLQTLPARQAIPNSFPKRGRSLTFNWMAMEAKR
jgi:hypothetical protein